MGNCLARSVIRMQPVRIVQFIPGLKSPTDGEAMERLKGLKCRECGRYYPSSPIHVCEFCFGPLEVDYDYEVIRGLISRKRIESGPPSIWRYADLLPLDLPEGEPHVGQSVGFTPLVRARNLAEELGVKELWVKNDSVCHPTWSFKDRVVAVAIGKAKEFGFDTVACASTGNLANSVAAHSAEARLKSYIFIPADLERGKVITTLVYGATLVAVEGTYDEVNRLCAEVGDKYRWAFVNINIRPYYAEGSKTYGYEIAEQLGWRAPAHVVVPCAGGSLITKIAKAFKELRMLGLIPGGQDQHVRRAGARLRAHRDHDQEGLGRARAGAAQHHRQVAGHRQSGRRLLRVPRGEGLGRLRRARHRRGDHRGHAAPGAHRGHLHRDRRRRDRGGDEEAHRLGADPARTSRSSSASRATGSRRPTCSTIASPST